MKLWELLSVCRQEPHLVADLPRPRHAADRAVLDAEVADGVCRRVLAGSRVRLYAAPDGRLRTVRHSAEDRELTALEVYDRHGGSAIEEALEYGSADRPSRP